MSANIAPALNERRMLPRVLVVSDKAPESSVSWRHFVFYGIGFRQIGQFVDRLRDEPEVIERIGFQGRQQALKHYSPKAMARRLLTTLGYDEQPMLVDPTKCLV